MTNINNSGVRHNLLLPGIRRNQIEFYMKKGFGYEQSNKLLSLHQKEINKIANEIDNKLKTLLSKNKISKIEDYYLILIEKNRNFNYKELYKPYDLIRLLSNQSIIEKYGLKNVYNKLYKMDNTIFKYEVIKFKRMMYGYISYTKNGDILRSKLEYDFYRLLETNGIFNYRIGKQYANSKYMYDFYLIDYDIYIEIAGMMTIESYVRKMNHKKEIFKNLYILETYNDMLKLIQKIKGINENKIY